MPKVLKPFNPTQKELAQCLRPEERDRWFNDNHGNSIGWCACGVITQLGIGCMYLCTRCQIKKYGKLL